MNGSLPSVVTLVLMIAIICIWPGIVLWAPQTFRQGLQRRARA